MKNIQVIDGADNCTYSIYAATDEEFNLIFPDKGQNIEFIEDIKQKKDHKIESALEKIWDRYIEKREVNGIHGTLFFELEYKKKYYPTKKDTEMIVVI